MEIKNNVYTFEESNDKENITDDGRIIPNHYLTGNLETLTVLKYMLTEEGFKGLCKFLVLKYIDRVRFKECPTDIKLRAITKAKYYLNELVQLTKDKVIDSVELDYYKHEENKMEFIDIAEDQLTFEEMYGVYTGMIIKYVLRADKKEMCLDYSKAYWYIEKLIVYLEKQINEAIPEEIE